MVFPVWRAARLTPYGHDTRTYGQSRPRAEPPPEEEADRQAVELIPSQMAARRVFVGPVGGQPPAFDAERHKARNVVERCFSRLNQFRAVATRFDKLAARYPAGLRLASLVLWLREPQSFRQTRPSTPVADLASCILRRRRLSACLPTTGAPRPGRRRRSVTCSGRPWL